MELTHRRCSNCTSWGAYKFERHGLVVAHCGMLKVSDGKLGDTAKISEGGERCGEWFPANPVSKTTRS